MNENIRLNEAGDGIIIIDQTLLPNEEKYIELKTPEEMYEAIEKLRVRGAPAIGIFADMPWQWWRRHNWHISR